ncbi:MAG: 7-cyano-7-deazaguanine synthase [Pseudomonadota bacterium]
MSSGGVSRPRDGPISVRVAPRKDSDGDRLHLTVGDREIHATLRLEKFAKRLMLQLSDRALDLIEIAAVVYAADAAIQRGTEIDRRLGAKWRRHFAVKVPVREPGFWAEPETRSALRALLGLLSDDTFEFTFGATVRVTPEQASLKMPGQQSFAAEEALLFSGGLDSLAGALEETVNRGNRVLLVSHHSSTKLQNAQTQLVEGVAERVGSHMIRHVPLSLQVGEGQSRENTHRTRSFFFAAVCVSLVALWGLDRVRFYENGIVSMNLPISGQVISSRATRSTHPQVLTLMTRLFSRVFGRPIRVDNPLFWKTKTEVVAQIRDLGAADLIRQSRSCGAARELTKMHSHCGVCSQCIDRRFAMLAAGVAEHDPASSYEVDPLLGDREGKDREMALGYIEAARNYQRMDARAFFSHYGEATRAVAHLGLAPGPAAERLFQLHRRHGEQVTGVLDRAIKTAIDDAEGNGPGPSSPVILAGLARLGGTPAAIAEPASGAILPKGRASGDEPLKVRLRKRNVVEIEGLGSVKGASAELLVTLSLEHLSCRGLGLSPEDFSCIRATKLANRLRISEETVRRRVLQARKAIRALAKEAGLDLPEDDAFIENLPWHGYRLNPITAVIDDRDDRIPAKAPRQGRSRRTSGS